MGFSSSGNIFPDIPTLFASGALLHKQILFHKQIFKNKVGFVTEKDYIARAGFLNQIMLHIFVQIICCYLWIFLNIWKDLQIFHYIFV